MLCTRYPPSWEKSLDRRRRRNTRFSTRGPDRNSNRLQIFLFFFPFKYPCNTLHSIFSIETSFEAKLKRVKKSPFYDLPKTGDRYFLYHTCSRESIAQPNSSRPNVHLYRSSAYLYIHEWGCRELMRDRKGRESCVTRRHNYREYGYTRVLYIMNFKSVQLLRATLPLSLSLFDEIGRKVMVGV